MKPLPFRGFVPSFKFSVLIDFVFGMAPCEKLDRVVHTDCGVFVEFW